MKSVWRYFVKGILLSVCLSAAAFSQTIVMEGKVRDANTHREISGVNIYIRALDIGTVSNESGRFQLIIQRPEPEIVVTFQHVAYDTLEMMIEDVLSAGVIEMQERVILTPVVEVESIADQLDIERDLPQSVAVLDARIYDLHGYLDVGDVLRAEQSIQIDEELSGKKTVSIRGGNPDEVIVLYNGIRLNNALDNIFDVSLIDLSDLERLEVIKGSNTALYGPEAFSGVINVVPRSQQDYNFRFQQRIGSHNSGDWGVNLYKNFGKLYAGYTIKKGASQRTYLNEPTGRRLLNNRSEHHTASLTYHFKETRTGQARSSLGAMYVRSQLDYDNERDSETLKNFNQMFSMRFNGNIGSFTNVSLSGAYQWLEETQFLRFADQAQQGGFLTRGIKSRSWHFNGDKTLHYGPLKLLLGYQYQRTRLDFQDDRFTFNADNTDLNIAALKRQNHGFISIGKLHIPFSGNFFRSLNFDVSFRYDLVNDQEIAPISGSFPGVSFSSILEQQRWKAETVKFSIHTHANNGIVALNSFLNVGTNAKFPTLLQQISTREMLAAEINPPSLEPESNRSIEIGVDLSKEVRKANLFGWQTSANLFYNHYKNKFRTFALPGTPIAFYDNVPSANISGYELRQKLFLMQKKVTLEAGYSRYFLSDLAAFPFKHDRKYIFNIQLDENGYSLRIHGYKEGKQVAQIRNVSGGFSEISLAAVSNLDIFFNKSFEINRIKLFLNASFRNLINDDFQLEGLTLRDRRYYFTVGVQY